MPEVTDPPCAQLGCGHPESEHMLGLTRGCIHANRYQPGPHSKSELFCKCRGFVNANKTETEQATAK